MGEQPGEGLKAIHTRKLELGGLAHCAAAHVEEDEDGNDHRVAGNASMRLAIDQRLWVEVKVAAAGDEETAHHQGDHTQEHEKAEDVGAKIVERARGVGRRDREREISLDAVDQVDQDIKDKAVKDEGVKEADDRTIAEGTPLCDGGDERVRKPPQRAIPALLRIRTASPHAQVKAIKAPGAQRSQEDGRDQEGDFLVEWQHARMSGLKP